MARRTNKQKRPNDFYGYSAILFNRIITNAQAFKIYCHICPHFLVYIRYETPKLFGKTLCKKSKCYVNSVILGYEDSSRVRIMFKLCSLNYMQFEKDFLLLDG